MSTLLSAGINAQARFTYDQLITGLNNSENASNFVKQISFANGGGAGQCDFVYCNALSIAASATTTLALAGGALLDPLNLAFTAVRVKSALLWLVGTGDTLPDGTIGTACTSVKMSGLNGSGGFIDGTSPFMRAFNSGFAAFGVGNAAGVTSGLSLAITNEDSVNAALVLLAVFGAKE
jgi:hypothetical protein